MIKITRVRRQGIIASLFFLPILFLVIGWAVYENLWLEALAFLGIWLFLFLFMTSYLFQAAIIFLATLYYAVSQRVWWVGAVGILLTAYLYYANKLTDREIPILSYQPNSLTPSKKRLLELIDNLRNIFILVVGGVILTTIFASFLHLFVKQ